MSFSQLDLKFFLTKFQYFHTSKINKCIFLNSLRNQNQNFSIKTTTECAASNSTKLNDIIVVNLALCSDVQVKKEVEKVPDAPQSLNLQRVSAIEIRSNMPNLIMLFNQYSNVIIIS